MGIGSTDGRPLDSVRRWVSLGLYTGYETVQYAVLAVFLGVVTTVADRGSIGPSENGTPILLDIIDVEFVSTAVGTELGGQPLVTVMAIAIITLAAMTVVGVPILHHATIPIHTPQREYVFTLPDLSVFGLDIAPILAAIPVVVLVGRVALSGASVDGDVPPRDLLRYGVIVGLTHALFVLAAAALAREVLLAFLTAIAGVQTTTGITVQVIAVETVGVVTVYAVAFAVVGLTLGLAVRSLDLDALW